VGEPGFEGITNDHTSGAITFDHRFNEQWNLHLLGSYGQGNSHGCFVSSSINDPVNTPNIVSRYGGCSESQQKEGDVQAELQGKLDTGNIKHAVMFGVQDTTSDSPSGNIGYAASYGLSDLNVLNPQKGGAIIPQAGAPYNSDNYTKAQSIYAQDLISLNTQFKFLIGGREDHFSAQSYTNGAQTDDRPATHFSPRMGLVFQPYNSTSLYASYSNSFSPNSFGKLLSGGVPPPELGVQYEIGLKQDLLEGKANLNVATYQLTKKNSVQCAPSDPTCTFVVTVGEQRSRGIEVDLGGDLTHNLRVTVATSLMNAVVTQDLSIPVGAHLMGAPTRTFNLFGVYKFSDNEFLNGFELGGGYYYASETLGAYMSYPNQFNLPTIQRFDAMGSYSFNPKTKLQVNITNLTDHHNFMSNGFSPWPDQPRTVFATLRTKL